MRTSTDSFMRREHYKGDCEALDAPFRLLPLAPSSDPERQQDQLQVQPEAGPLQVQPIEPELAGAGNIARSIHLRQSSKAGPNAVTLFVSGNLIETQQLPIAARIDFTRTQRARADEAHVARKNVPQLRE